MTHTTHKNQFKNHKQKKQSKNKKASDTQKMRYALAGGKNFY